MAALSSPDVSITGLAKHPVKLKIVLADGHVAFDSPKWKPVDNSGVVHYDVESKQM